MSRPLLVSGLVCLLAGCGNLRVQVDVVDPEYVRTEIADETLRYLNRQIVQAQPGDFAAQLDRNFANYQREVGELAQRYEVLAKAYPIGPREALQAAAAGLRSAVAQGTIVSSNDRVGTTLEKQAQEIRELKASTRWSGRGPLPSEIREKLLAFQAESKTLAVQQQLDLRELAADTRKIASQVASMESTGTASAAAAPAIAAATKAVVEQEARTKVAAQRSIIEGMELSNTEYAYAVAKAPTDLWVPKYNEAFGRGTFGNVDIVLRMNSTADFSVKGMRFDASTVAQVASKVLTQSLLLGAQMAGVPVATATSGTGTGGDALSKQSADLATMEQSLARREALAEARKKAIRVTARSILSVAPQLETGDLKDKPKADPERSSVHDAVQITIDALRAQLLMQDLQ